MILISIATAFLVAGESLENKIIGIILVLIGAGIMLYKYKREMSRDIPQ